MTDVMSTPTPSSFPNTGVAGARSGKTLLRERFEAVKNTAIDNAMDKGESWAKKVESGGCGVMLDDIPRLMSVIGLKLVDHARICITQERLDEYEAYKTIARAHLAPAQPTLDQDFDQ